MYMKGFTFYKSGRDVFVVTGRKRVTDSLITEILAALHLPETSRNIIKRSLMKAKCEVRTLRNGRQYYEIWGDSFAGKGSFCDDGLTTIVRLGR